MSNLRFEAHSHHGAEARGRPGEPYMSADGRRVSLGQYGRPPSCCRTWGRRMVRAWCSVDHVRAGDIADEPGNAGGATPAHGSADGQLAARRARCCTATASASADGSGRSSWG